MGEGVPRDTIRAVTLLQKAADSGDAEAKVALANFYLHGDGASKDASRALLLLRSAADAGYAPAALMLSELYAGKFSPTESLEWCRKAAEAGHPHAQFNFGHDAAQGRQQRR